MVVWDATAEGDGDGGDGVRDEGAAGSGRGGGTGGGGDAPRAAGQGADTDAGTVSGGGAGEADAGWVRDVLDRPGLTAGEREILRVLGREDDPGSVGSQIVVSLGASIIEGRMRPGDDLNSVDLARRFRSSRTPVREALAILEREGLVEIAARRRPRVRTLGLAEVREIYELRAELYGLVSRRIVLHCPDRGLDELRAAQAELESAAAAADLERYFWLVVGFRNMEARLAANETVRGVLDSVGIRTLQLRHLSLSLPGRVETSVGDHRRLLKAYVDRDADLASALTRSIVRRGLAAVEGSGWTGFSG
ncbi:GntR family transcriptional regulator [Streptomyces fuscigenes]|uniref:GntR family transcriptional regulator n=1 Tax=Streptomyces fuscigenes TaxID=1528880 RepID=UPI001F1DEBB8|nr:GntR family transcriptional regulator [Streptomyces fuscigenes]MCF3960700.1 GntR family transcriptional regulator [Streptomyces fuscigenes]